ncbi:hypothetical protein [Gulosibacter sp. 10]|uniref:hypothetical protein n=1 Tax=Gulosibacter sp. 10 TaxID=1255570 RepID=UPI00097EBC35|nr:hypothetical protein [Gulosibacter sp. 10]SJM66524.1 hypothetical protein FM112_11840 [Gulosibacter sp. 10]
MAARPRTAVIADAWRAAGIDAPAFTNREGRVLARAVKCLIDPLVLRPRDRAGLARPLLDEAAAEEVRRELARQRGRLEAAGEWFALLRRERRRRGITAGDVQELYFPRAYELAALAGPPGADAQERCAAMLAEVHAEESGAAAVREYLRDEDALRRAEADLRRAWRGAPEAVTPQAEALPSLLFALLDECGEIAARRGFGALLASGAPTAAGLDARGRAGVVRELAERLRAEEPGGAVSAHDPLAPPPVLERAASAAALDRALADRVRAALRRLRDRGTDEPIAERFAAEAARTAAPWGLESPAQQTVFCAGIALALWLRPLDASAPPEAPRLARELQARARKEAFVLRARRLLCEGEAVHPGQRPVVDELRAFARPYLARLWTRLHGRDVLGEAVADGPEALELLSGILRSVLQDQKQRIRRLLERSRTSGEAVRHAAA